MKTKKKTKSKKPGKQRLYLRKMPVHRRKDILKAHLSRELKKEIGKRSHVVRKTDVVVIMRGERKGKKGKVVAVNRKSGFIHVEGITKKKSGGREVFVPIKASNLKIVELGKVGK